jgi:hypothetical protein
MIRNQIIDREVSAQIIIREMSQGDHSAPMASNSEKAGCFVLGVRCLAKSRGIVDQWSNYRLKGAFSELSSLTRFSPRL